MSYELTSLLDSILGTHHKHAHGEFYWSCPFCHHAKPKLAINVTKGAWHCWVCNASGRRLVSLFRKLDCSRDQLAQLAKILDEDVYQPNTTDHEVVHLNLPQEFKPFTVPTKLIEYKRALQYITQRGITASDIMRYQIGYCSDGNYAGRIIIPSFDATGKLNYFVGRSFYEPTTMKYKNPPVSKNVIGFDMHINWKYPIVLCEGVYDAIAIKRNAIPLLGKTMPGKLAEKIVIENVQHIYLALDADALRQTARMASELIREGRAVYVVDLDGKDPSEIGFTRMSELIKNAKPLGFAELVKLRATA